MFTSFNLQAENNTDAVYVYDGDSEAREVLGVFYGGNLPPKGIYSSSNNLLVVFKSDKNGSYTGFQAVYHAINCSGKLTYAVLAQCLQEVLNAYFISDLRNFRNYVLKINLRIDTREK